jgi:hypothetical protein
VIEAKELNMIKNDIFSVKYYILKDAYDILFKSYKKETFFKEGLAAIIYVEDSKINNFWNETKQKIRDGGEFFIRGFGRDENGTKAFFILYKELFPKATILKDPINNIKPTQIISKLTGLDKNIKADTKSLEKIQNYQVSHLFGKTKNPLLFTAPWNIAFIPKYLDPFTGHETRGEYSIEFKKIFNESNLKRFKKYIADYDNIVLKDIKPNFSKALDKTKKELISLNFDQKKINEFEKAALEQLDGISKSILK